MEYKYGQQKKVKGGMGNWEVHVLKEYSYLSC